MNLRGWALCVLVGTGCGPSVGDESGSDAGTTTEGTSTSTTSDDACALAPDPGSCDAAFPYWYFDPASGRCQIFIYGGCDGVVPFVEEDDCVAQCEGCEAFTDPPTPFAASVSVTVRNTTPNPVWIMGYEATPDAVAYRTTPIKLADFQGTVLVTTPNACDLQCSSYLANGCVWGCSDAGPPPGPILLQPGGQYSTSVPAQFLRPTEVPATCLAEQCPGADGLACGRFRGLSEFQDYQVFVDYATTAPCSEPEACACMANADGWCQLGPTFDPASYPERAEGFLSFGSPAQIDI